MGNRSRASGRAPVRRFGIMYTLSGCAVYEVHGDMKSVVVRRGAEGRPRMKCQIICHDVADGGAVASVSSQEQDKLLSRFTLAH